MKTQASKVGEHQTPGRVGRGFAACWARNGYSYEACGFSVRAKHTARIFVQEKRSKLVLERCVEVFSIRSTVHDCFFYPSNTQVFRFRELTTIHVFLDVDNQATFKRCLKLSFKITKELPITIPYPKRGCDFLISYPPQKNGWHISPQKRKNTTPKQR